MRKGYTEGQASGGLTPVAPTVKSDRPAPKPEVRRSLDILAEKMA